ncbi:MULTISPECIES: aminoglycoside phosphotransferase family protein [Bacillus cereus group]|uniref:aminoglycoside phosphotransferase family protein n=1 Tax=Bacillus cereus group TaxID=86661 RepID=UPI000772D15E|nr:MULTISPECIES: aminoglycoside phosphotransferase family protein [Bacillus cereus group]ASI78020.1 aminoglycoside phosphotransferase [Bacillus cereus]KXI55821.1 aminoglycoside phosphotransferase [Bacillus cereus]MCC2484637.1 aminoglycoside phosphotransferase family protein [Bacillus pacificus]MDA1605863.1 aminoglycoside phosphotransferase family protein [Bacillus cereus group sp. TH208-1LC]MDA2767251.1 aminoglycoside phosphotransferase family protein [Bacillus cereus group sp. Bc010]
MNLDNLIAKGNTAEIYLYDNKIVKLFKDYLPDTESMNEAKKQKYACSCGLPVPNIFEVIKIQNRQAIIMEYIKGDSIGNLLLNNLNKAEHYINICVNEQKKIHSICVNTDEIESMRGRLERQIKSVHKLDEKQKENILNKLHSIKFEPRLCHGDFHPFNLILSKKNVNIIDWVDASSGDIRADVFRTYLLYAQSHIELAEMYLQIYCNNTDLTRDEIFQWAPIISVARFTEKVSLQNEVYLSKLLNQYL